MALGMNSAVPVLCCPCCDPGTHLGPNPARVTTMSPAGPAWMPCHTPEAVGYTDSKTTSTSEVCPPDPGLLNSVHPPGFQLHPGRKWEALKGPQEGSTPRAGVCENFM